MADLSVEIAGVRFKNPVMLASSEVTENFDKMKLGIDAGAGAVVAKSYCNGPEEKKQTDLAKYTFLGYDRRPAYGKNIPKLFTNYSRTGLIQKSEDEWFEELEKTEKYAVGHDAYVIGSVFGVTDVAEMNRLVKKMEQIGLKMVEIDLACPHPDEMKAKGALLKDSQDYFSVTKGIVEGISIPVIIKLSPQQADLVPTAMGVKEQGAAGVTCHNRTLGFVVDIDKAEPLIWGWAGVGGPWMLPIALRWVSKIYQADPSFPIFGSSGAYDWEDVVQFIMAGASAVEFCSSVMAKGYSIIRNAVQGLDKFMDAKGYKSVQDIIGVATRAAYSYEEMYTLAAYKEKASVDVDKCIGCGKCLEVCWYDAMQYSDGVYTVNEANCKGCRNCKAICPVEGCITIRTIG